MVMLGYVYLMSPEKLHQLDLRPRPVQPEDSMNSDAPLVLRDPARASRLIWARGLTTGTALCFYLAGLRGIAVSEHTSVLSTKSFVIGFLCWVVMREGFGWRLPR